MNLTVIGIDPGKAGAVVAFTDEGISYWLGGRDYTQPLGKGAKRDYRVDAMARILRELPGVKHLFLERQGARPEQGGVSNFTTGYGYGLWQGIAVALMIPVHVIIPQEWSSVICKGFPGDGKARTIAAMGNLLPELNLVPEKKRVPDIGLADAAALAFFGKHHHLKESP